ncbi:hypothetical protein Agabi119p4_6891 [Agaricus bisporus var. burnettii]|uniref:Uncharacterized protein n=1 Tax=Agaricus bisporus var. burnettii TaxID=192524 RepID=A0A8H7F0D6_AGABI|nr:hypothetical protein Agabi119p4_6891 [Agaricus bisporus var. burnettii]
MVLKKSACIFFAYRPVDFLICTSDHFRPCRYLATIYVVMKCKRQKKVSINPFRSGMQHTATRCYLRKYKNDIHSRQIFLFNAW